MEMKTKVSLETLAKTPKKICCAYLKSNSLGFVDLKSIVMPKGLHMTEMNRKMLPK
jgi:hypothetical protein